MKTSGDTRPQRISRPILAAAFLAAVFFVLPFAARAQADLGLNFATGTGLATTDIRTAAGNIVKIFLGLLGLVAVLLILYAGFLWMTARGNEEQIQKAKQLMANAAIGLAIIIGAYAITYLIFNALQGGGPGTGGNEGGGGSALTSLYCADCGSDQLGKIIAYHYPEVGQTDVPRNTKISITFKKPLVLSSVFRNYDDKGTYDAADDVVCRPDCRTAGHAELTCRDKTDEAACAAVADGVCAWSEGKCLFNLETNTDNFKVLPNESLGPVRNTQDKDADFNARYPDAATGLLSAPPPHAASTAVSVIFDPDNQGQTIVLKPAAVIGSADKEVNYRVALRGGVNGILVWDAPTAPGTACARQNAGEKSAKCLPAFSSPKADGSYFWAFTTSVSLDVTPPRLVAVFPFVQKPEVLNNPTRAAVVVRNQILQSYFDEAIDPTTATGRTGTGANEGFNWINVEAKCLAGLDCPFGRTDFSALSGELTIGNRYRTVEFTPSAPCEGVSENSCGQPVYCLPKNAELRLTAKASAVDPQNRPAAVFPPSGVTDMAGNSFDGNANGQAEGPTVSGLSDYDLNRFFGAPPSDKSPYSDTAAWRYHVGDEVDLTPPAVMDILPKSPPPEDAAYPAGPSQVPAGRENDIVVSWSKVMSPSSMVAGTTVLINSSEWKKTADAACTAETLNRCERLASPTVVIGVSEPLDDGSGRFYTEMQIKHREFFTANDLGWSEADIQSVVPTYLPVIRAQIKDTTQNCFFPSQGYRCSPTDAVNSSCYNRTAGPSFDWQP